MDGTVSIASYRPKTEMDYGTLLCWGDNELGRQSVPCVFHIIPAGKLTRFITKSIVLVFLFVIYHAGKGGPKNLLGVLTDPRDLLY